MNLGQIAQLGKIAGIGGISLGVVATLGSELIGTVKTLPATDRASTVWVLATGCFAIGVLGLIVWAIGLRQSRPDVSTEGDESPGVIARNVYINAPAPPPSTGKGGKAVPTQAPVGVVHTRGNASPGVLAVDTAIVNAPPAAPVPPPAAPGPKGPKRG
jgi:hypothetical protein